jgi:hypothetical protein
MNKEIVLEKFKKYTELLKESSIRGKEIGEAIGALNSCDQLWVIDEHGKWMRANYPEDVKKAEEIKSRLPITN